MNNDSNDFQRISRRAALAGTALVLGAAAAATAVTQSSAQQKISQADAKYQATPKDDQRCDGCVNFEPPNACKFVQGDISPSGWCQLFVKKT
ncbi:MAG: high potential iron sulfur protein [Xanthobacteraceae bacterium]